MAQLRRAKNYVVSFLAILISTVVSWFGAQPPAWAKSPAKAHSSVAVKKAKKTAKASPSRRKPVVGRSKIRAAA